jgi:hypothetical protein
MGVVDQKKTMSHLGMNVCSILDAVEITWGRNSREKEIVSGTRPIADPEVPSVNPAPLAPIISRYFPPEALAPMTAPAQDGLETWGADFQSRFDKSTAQAQRHHRLATLWLYQIPLK